MKEAVIMKKVRCLNLEKICFLSLLIFILVNPIFAVTELEEKYYSHLPVLLEKFGLIEPLKAKLVIQDQNGKELAEKLYKKIHQLKADGMNESELRIEEEKEANYLDELYEEFRQTAE